MFSPSLPRENSVFLYTAQFPTTTMTSADFSVYRNTKPNLRPPSVRLLSFNLSPPYLLIRNQQLSGFVLLCILTLPYQPLIRFLFVGTDLCSLAYFRLTLTGCTLATCFNATLPKHFGTFTLWINSDTKKKRP